jgi:ankyrin repeat protein
VASQNGHTSTVVALIEDGHADVNQAHKNGATPLFIASQNGHLSVVTELIRLGANINAARATGATPLFMAAQVLIDHLFTNLLVACCWF